MTPSRRTARIAGLWFIGTFVFSIPALLFYDSVLSDADYILGSGFDTSVSVGALLEIGVAIANIATAVVLFPILRRVKEAVALGYVTVRTIESAMILVGVISVMSIVTLRDDLAGSGVDPESLTLAGQSLVAFHDWSFVLGPQFCSGFGNGLLLGYLLYKGKLVPPRVALLGLIGGPLCFLGGVLVLFGVLDAPSPGLFVITAPEIAWELFLCVYLTFFGFRRSRVTEEYDRLAVAS